MAARHPSSCECCRADVDPDTTDNCSCTLRPWATLVHECRLIQLFNEKLNFHVQPPNEECFLSVAILNVGIKRDDTNIRDEYNEFRKATDMCGRPPKNGRIPFCKAMAIKCSLDQWKTYPDFVILSEAPNNLNEKLREFLPMYDFFYDQFANEDCIFLCWKGEAWKPLSETIERIEVPGFKPKCRAVRLQRSYKNASMQTDVTVIGVHLPSKETKDKKRKNTTCLRDLIKMPNHGVVIIGGDFNLDIHECFPSTDEILVPSSLPTAKSACIDNIVVAKLECQSKMKVTVVRRDVISVRDDQVILDHNPVLGVFHIENATCTNQNHKCLE
jgi:hypothetical protein